jgi:transketolase
MASRRQLANAIRALSMDAVQQANSGHPGAPMGMADIAEVLWNDFLQHNPTHPQWLNRDRFVLSNGHSSMLLYSLLHLSGYDLSIDDLKHFRQLHSKTAGHPELGHTPGIETTTGPLGQGMANAVGMAIAEKVLAHQFNRPDYELVDHFTYVFLGDGCLMEGISHEACSLAGTLRLGKLVAFYDDNGISIDGEVEGWFSDDTPKRFEAYGWHVIPAIDGHDANAIYAAIEEARQNTSQPTLICCKTLIGFGSPNKEGKEDCHGAPLGIEEIALTRQALGWSYGAFDIPADIYEEWDAKDSGYQVEQDWNQQFRAYNEVHPELADELLRRISGDLPASFNDDADAYIARLQTEGITVASRKASQNTLNAFGPMLPELFGGSADLAGSNLTLWQGCKGIDKVDASGNYLYYGVREFAMSAIMNGMALHGGFIPYGATFLVFMEYARNAVRMAALMQQRVLFVYTHDSIGLGEDGPTHQPVEQLANLRLTPNLDTWRPCDTVESAVAWKASLQRHDGPAALVFSRQALSHQQRSQAQIAAITQGGYILSDCDGLPEAIIIATGSEVTIAMQAATDLVKQGRLVRVVSMPCTSVFERQLAEYREHVLPAAVTARVAVEAAHKDYWYKYVGLQGKVIGISEFGASAPADKLYEWYGITVTAIIKAVNSLV